MIPFALLEKINKNPRIEDITNAKKLLQNPRDFKNFNKQFLVSSVLQLRNDKLSKDVKLHFIELMQFVIEQIHVNDIHFFLNIHKILLIQIYVDPKFTNVISEHEEFKENVIKCWKTLFKRATSNVIEELYTKNNATTLAAGIHACTLIAKNEKSISLRFTAIECMMYFLQIQENVDETDDVLRDQISEVLVFFLPGITSTLYEIATASETQHHSLTVIAIRVLGKFLSFVMKDSPESEKMSDLMPTSPDKTSSDVLQFNIKGSIEEKVKQQLEKFKRTPQWYKQAALKLTIVFEKLKILTHHVHYKVRKELVCFVREILLSCTRNLRPCFDNVFEILVTLTEDEFSEIAKCTTEIIDFLHEKSERGDIKSVLDICEENLYNILIKFPRIMRTSDDSTQLIFVKELVGYLKLLKKDRLSHIMMSSAHSTKLIMALVYATELDCRNISLFNDITIQHIVETDHYLECKWKQYKFIYSSATEEKIQLVCHILGESGCLQILVDSIFNFIARIPQYKQELLLLMNWMLESDHPMTVTFYKQIIEQIILPEVWYLPEVTENVSLNKAQSNVAYCCLLTETLGIIAEKLQSEFDQFLLKTLYIVVERAGHENRYLSFCGRQCLNKIAKSQNCDSVANLLQSNVDYISYYVSIKLKRIEINCNVLNVIKVVMETSVIDFLPSLKGIVDNIFLNTKKRPKKQNILLYLKVFYIFTMAIKRMTSTREDYDFPKKIARDKVSISNSVIKTILKYSQAKQNASNFESEPENVSIDEDEIKEGMGKYCEEGEENSVKKLPYYINLIENITKNCLHYLPSKDIETSLLSMSILGECFLILQEYEDILLPLVHQTWHPLVERFRNENPIIISRAWDLMKILASLAKDFIQNRTLKEILPSIKQFLTKSAKTSLKKDNTKFYEYTQVYKLQRNLLTELSKVCIYLSLNEEDLWKILEIVQPYLSSQQYPTLKEFAINLFTDFIAHNADIVWVKCLDIWNTNIGRIPVNNFESWYFKIHECNAQNEYVQSLKIIFSTIEKRESFCN